MFAAPSRGLATVYGQLSKWRLSSMVVLSCGGGYLMACPTGSCTTAAAVVVGFGTAIGAAGTGLLLAATNPAVAALGAANIGLYAGVYTPMKTRSRLNTAVGQVVGAIPPIMGYAAAVGSTGGYDAMMAALVAPEALLAAALLFAWQGPHFYALAWRARKDYARGGHQMESVVDPSGASTAALISAYAGGLTVLPLAAAAMGVIHPAVCVPATAIHAHLLYLAKRFHEKRSDANAGAVFFESLWYLPVMMALFAGGAYWQRKRVAAADRVTAVAVDASSAAATAAAAAVMASGDKPTPAAEAAAQHADADSGSKCVTGATGLRGLCVHESLRGSRMTPTCSEVEATATAVVSKQSPAL